MGFHQYISLYGKVIPQKPLILETAMGISSLNNYMRISAHKKQILMLDGSKCASRQDTQCAIRQNRGRGNLKKTSFQKEKI
jgi:hypothetical protein